MAKHATKLCGDRISLANALAQISRPVRRNRASNSNIKRWRTCHKRNTSELSAPTLGTGSTGKSTLAGIGANAPR
jgi:hypothetical protein